MKSTKSVRSCSTYFSVLLEAFLKLGVNTILFLYLSFCFSSMEINSNHKIFFAFLSVCLIYLLSKTIKPIMIRFTIPLTGMSLGLFYFVINAIIFKMADVLLCSKLNFYGMFSLFFIALLYSLFTTFFEKILIRPIVRRVKHE